MHNAPIIKEGTLAENIRKLRVSERLTQRDLARLASVNQRDIDYIEREIPLQLETKLKILKILYARKLLY